jgi:hypothetical protein
MSRNRQEEQAFGSDSFLDIICNMVGILIILIVIAGIRVARAPARPTADTLAQSTPAIAVTSPEIIVPTTVATPPQKLPTLDITRVSEQLDRTPIPDPLVPAPRFVESPLPPIPRPELSAERRAEETALRRALEDLAASRRQLEATQRESAARLAAVAQEAADLERQVSQRQQALQSNRDQLAAGEAELAETAERLSILKTRLTEDDAPPAQVIHHAVTPIGRVVTGEELHFHLSGGRVTPVPIEDLARRLKAEIEHKREMFAKLPRYEGTIGPVDGFRMSYVIERMQLSLAEELKHGPQVVRMQVTQWTMLPEPDLPSETADEAIQRGSGFYNALLTAGPSATMTFWVYEDSFDLCRRLQDFAHQHGYDVAARPLPHGIPITGSPEGSKSISQ